MTNWLDFMNWATCCLRHCSITTSECFIYSMLFWSALSCSFYEESKNYLIWFWSMLPVLCLMGLTSFKSKHFLIFFLVDDDSNPIFLNLFSRYLSMNLAYPFDFLWRRISSSISYKTFFSSRSMRSYSKFGLTSAKYLYLWIALKDRFYELDEPLVKLWFCFRALFRLRVLKSKFFESPSLLLTPWQIFFDIVFSDFEVVYAVLGREPNEEFGVSVEVFPVS